MRTNCLISSLTLLSVALLSAPSVQADTLAYWNMDASGAAKTNVNTVASSVTVTPIGTVNLGAVGTVTPVFNPALPSGDNYAGMSRSSSTGGGNWDNTLATAYGFSTYFQFTLAPTAGPITVTGISFDAVAATTTTTANREFFLESSLTGYGTSSANVLYGAGTQAGLNPGGGINWSSTLIPFNDTAANTGPYSETLFSADLSGNSAFQNISGPVTFRVYIATDTVNQNLGFDNLTVVGVPEPSSFAFISFAGLAALLAVGRRRLQA